MSSLEDKLYNILNDLEKYKNETRQTQLTQLYIKNRLDKSTLSYIHDLSLTLISAKNNNFLKVVKELNK